MWIVYYDDDDVELILDIVVSYEDLVNYFKLFQEQYPTFIQIRPIPNLSEEGVLVHILEEEDTTLSIIRMIPRSAPPIAFEIR
jgi:hypothetical protein